MSVRWRSWTLIVLGAVGLFGLLVTAFWSGVRSDPSADPVGLFTAGLSIAYLLAVFVIRRRPEHPQAVRLLLGVTALSISESLAIPLQRQLAAGRLDWWWIPLNLLSLTAVTVSVVAIVAVIALYPSGFGERRWQHRTIAALWWLLAIPPVLVFTSPHLVVPYFWSGSLSTPVNPLAVPWLGWLGTALTAVLQLGLIGFVGPAVLFIRYLQADRSTRRPMRFLSAIAIAGSAALLAQAILLRFGIAGPVFGICFGVCVFLAPFAVALGILRFGVFEIEVAIRRSVVVAVLSVGVALVYAVLAAGPGLALGRDIPVQLAVLLTVGLALAFQPLRRRLDLRVDRWVFGERVNRYRVLTQLGADLDRNVELDDLLPTLATAVSSGLGARWVRISLRDSGAGWLAAPVGLTGEPAGDATLVQSMSHRGELVGRIECGPARDPYSNADGELLATLAGQAAVAIANVRLTAQLAERLAELSRSRSRLVSAQDTERRRIERDLHDGVQQGVVALILKMGMARGQLARGSSPDPLLVEMMADARSLLTELRALAQGIRPPVLADQGLLAAVESRIARLPMTVTVAARAELRVARFDADVEATAYFVICEALTNAAKHAAAERVEIDLSTAGLQLSIGIRDHGTGFDPVRASGSGLVNLRDRVEAIGGTLQVDSSAGEGTLVRAQLPIASAAAA